MNKPRFVREVCGRKSLSVVMVVICILSFSPWGTASGQSSQAGLASARYYMNVGDKQFKQGAYEDAEKYLLKAQGYQQYLPKKERDKLSAQLERAHTAAVSRQKALQDLESARLLAKQGKTEDVSALIAQLKGNAYLTDDERKEVNALMVTDDTAAAQTSEVTMPPMPEDLAVDVVSSDEASGPADSYIEKIKRDRMTVRSHVQAVVSDTRMKVAEYIAIERYDLAENEVDKTRHLVESSSLHLGSDLTRRYSLYIEQLAAQVASASQESTWRAEQARREALRVDQTSLAEEQAIEQQKTIIELMKQADTFKKRQLYDAALAQVEGVLRIEPQHDGALRLKTELQDIILYRRQYELENKSEEQRTKMLINTTESSIPYAEEMNYGDDWLEITQKETRQPDKPIELDPDNAAVYEQLEEMVDMSELSPELPANTAFDILRDSVTPPLQIVVLWKDLFDNAEIEQTTPIDMDGLPDVRLGTALENLLSALGGGFYELAYVVEGGVIKVGTLETLPKKLETRIYDITDLVQAPSMGMSMMGGGGMMGGMGGGMMGGGMGGMGGGMMGGGMGGMGGGMMGGGMGGYGGGGMMGGGMGGMGGGMMGGGMGGMGGGMMGGGMGGMGGGYGGGGMMGGGMGGGMMGGMGGMGGGMMGGGMGGMGGGMMGGGMMGGGMMGGGGMGMMNSMRSSQGAYALTTLIQQTIEPDSWYDMSDLGEGTITMYPTQSPKKLAVLATREVHKQIDSLLTELRVTLGDQVSIEARFLAVGENFLKDIGIDAEMIYNGLGDKWSPITLNQNSYDSAKATGTSVPGSIGDIAEAARIGGSWGTILNTLSADFIIRATEGRTDSKTLSEPKATVMNGEAAMFSMTDSSLFYYPPSVQTAVISGSLGSTTQNQQNLQQPSMNLSTGSQLSIEPVITKDKKHVLLNIDTMQMDFLGIRTQRMQSPMIGADGSVTVTEWENSSPQLENSTITTRVCVPDGGTLLLGGQKIMAEVDKESGIPILRRLPVIGSLFGNRSKVRDRKVLLILVKPTIMLKDERDKEALEAVSAANTRVY
ncbi:MAG: hypothetical protein K9N55_14705 [Phycisphaerae bacterium]|nr:hypothetical protein [Phycisphaerae bacterium]